MNKFFKNYLEYREKSGFIDLQEYEKPYISQEQIIKAVEKNGLIIEHIDNPSDDVQLAAVKQNPNAIKYINEPSEYTQLVAVKKQPNNFRFIRYPYPSVINLYKELTNN